MPFADPKVRAAQWTEKDYMDRLQEVRTELIPDLYANRADTDDWKARNASVLTELDELDTEMRVWRMKNIPALSQPRSAPEGSLYVVRDIPVSMGRSLYEDEGIQSYMKHHRGQSPTVTLDFRAPGDPVTPTGVASTYPAGQPTQVAGYRRALRIRDLLTVVNTTLGSIPFSYVNNNGDTTNAAPVAVGALKPLSELATTPGNAPVETIAAGMRVAERVAEDSAAAAQLVDSQLTYEVMLAEETQIISGSGTSPNLKGILDYAGEGLQVQAPLGDAVTTIGAAIGKVQDRGGDVEGIVLRGSDAWGIWTNRSAGSLDAGNPFGAVPNTIWGYPTVTSNAVAAGSALVGAFRTGGALYQRRGLDVTIYNQHADWALRNELLFLAEERVALTITRPDLFVNVDLAA